MANTAPGVDLMRRLHEGALQQAPSAYLAETRDHVCLAIEELLDVGARIRPLLVEGNQIGWVRGVHLTERKLLGRWVYDDLEMIIQLLRLGTTLTEEEIRNLSTLEMRSLCRLVESMTVSDLRLYSYLSPFVTTGLSEQLWYARGTEITSFRDRMVHLPDGAGMRILAASDQARTWAALCNYRIQARNRLEASFNAALIVRPWVGKGADAMTAELQALARSLQTDSFEPWKEAIRVKPDTNLEDGWAHSEDTSIEGMLRELKGFVNNDRHEQAVAAFHRGLQEAEERKQQEMAKRILRKREQDDVPTEMVIFTEAEVQAQIQAAQAARDAVKIVRPDEPQSSLASRLAKYR